MYCLNIHDFLTTSIKADMSMLNRTASNVAILFWGSVFCIIACVVMIFNTNYDKRKRLWMILMQASTTLLREHNINRLIAVPLKRNDDIIGFFAVANPTSNIDDVTVLSSIQYFITTNLEKKVQQEVLYNLSYRDMLTHIYNRNKYINMVESSKGRMLENVGVAYIDLNGLKKVNDNNGHAQGDMFICTAANVVSGAFPDNCYRVGGDEFVVVVKNIDNDVFQQAIDTMKENMRKKNVSISIGVLYREQVDDLEKLLKSADKLMYMEKEAFHKENSGR